MTYYSDRLFLENPDKYDQLHVKHFGNESQSWDNKDHRRIEAFLSDFKGRELTLVNVVKTFDESLGFPVWVFETKPKDSKKN